MAGTRLVTAARPSNLIAAPVHTPLVRARRTLFDLQLYTGGRANVIPGIIMFSLFGFAGQYIYNALDARHHNTRGEPSTPTMRIKPSSKADYDTSTMQAAKPEEPLWKRVLNSKWSPMKVLSDEQYEKILREKLLRVEAELAIVDDDIERVKRREQRTHRDEKN
ncbi:MAG: hypothetical protein Q9198_008591 [Flavoplaca austrocitrina]